MGRFRLQIAEGASVLAHRGLPVFSFAKYTPPPRVFSSVDVCNTLFDSVLVLKHIVVAEGAQLMPWTCSYGACFIMTKNKIKPKLSWICPY